MYIIFINDEQINYYIYMINLRNHILIHTYMYKKEQL